MILGTVANAVYMDIIQNYKEVTKMKYMDKTPNSKIK